MKPLLLLGLFALVITACNKHMSGIFDNALEAPGNISTIGIGNTDEIVENPFIKTADSSITTFSVDADGGSYALTRKILQSGQSLENYKNSIRIEEYLNYFTYNYADPSDGNAIAVNGELATCPWNGDHRLIRIGIKGKTIAKADYPLANFVLLIDVSGSMAGSDRLELLKKGFIQFANQMRDGDKMAIVTYAGQETVALESTPGTQKEKIIYAIEQLGAAGSTNGEGGIKKAYQLARENFIPDGNNRVILGTDGDFNVGISSTDELVDLVEQEKQKGIFLTTLGVGLGNYNESMMEKIANKGDGNYEYLDSEQQMQKLFIDEYSKFLTVAKDVKVQVAFNKEIVEQYRLIGYENRALTNDDFADDSKDAGDIGAGQTVTALYEIKLRPNVNYKSDPAFKIDFRYKQPGGGGSIPLALDIYDQGHSFEEATEDLRFAASLAGLGLYLRNSAYKGTVTLALVKRWAANAVTFDPHHHRVSHLDLLERIR